MNQSLEIKRINMKNHISQLTRLFTIYIILAAFQHNTAYGSNAPAGPFDFTISILNVSQTSDRTFEFDLYLLDTDPAQAFELASVQCGVTINPAIYTGGTFSAIIIAGTSELNAQQVPGFATYTPGNGANIFKLSARNPSGNGTGSIISTTTPGTRIARIRLTSTVPFPSGTTPNMAFAGSTAFSPAYATRVAVYSAGLNAQLPVTPGVNAQVIENPVLNPQFPAVFSVTGGGTCCDNSGGLPVGISGSQPGVTYSLYRNDVPTGVSIQGTGSAINFPGGQTAGSYTVIGNNSYGTTQMSGNAMVLMNPSPVAQATSNSPLCTGTTLNLSSLPSSMTTYSWIGPNGFSSAAQNPSIANVTIPASGNYSVTVTNSYGCFSVNTIPVIVHARPVPTITGLATTCSGNTSVNYTTEPLMTNYSWNVSGGTITSGNNTNSITVGWGVAGNGTVSVNYTNSGNCQAAQPTVLQVTIFQLPQVSRSLNNITLNNGQDSCYSATQMIYVAGSGSTFNVNPGGSAHLIAGLDIYLYPGTTVLPGGNLHAYIANDCLFCAALKNSVLPSVSDSASKISSNFPSISENELFAVYPNPTNGLLTIRTVSSEKNSPCLIEVYNMQGIINFRQTITQNDPMAIDMSTLQPGLYFLKITKEDQTKTMKIIKL